MVEGVRLGLRVGPGGWWCGGSSGRAPSQTFRSLSFNPPKKKTKKINEKEKEKRKRGRDQADGGVEALLVEHQRLVEPPQRLVHNAHVHSGGGHVHVLFAHRARRYIQVLFE